MTVEAAMAARTMSTLGFSAEFERDENRFTHRQFWRYHVFSEVANERLFSGAAGDLKEAVDSVKAHVRYLAEQSTAEHRA